MKDPIKFTDIESQGVTIFLGIILIAMTIFLNNMFGLLCASIFAIIGLIGIYLRAWRRSVSVSPTDVTEIYSYLDVLYNNVGLFVKQYYDSDVAYNGQQSKSLQDKMKEFVPLLSRHKLSMTDKIEVEITDFFDTLVNYKRKVEGVMSCNKDEQAYPRWLTINAEFNKNVIPEFEKIKKALRK